MLTENVTTKTPTSIWYKENYIGGEENVKNEGLRIHTNSLLSLRSQHKKNKQRYEIKPSNSEKSNRRSRTKIQNVEAT